MVASRQENWWSETVLLRRELLRARQLLDWQSIRLATSASADLVSPASAEIQWFEEGLGGEKLNNVVE